MNPFHKFQKLFELGHLIIPKGTKRNAIWRPCMDTLTCKHATKESHPIIAMGAT
jgi:hypothetical protein